jgi:hypothetical protein
MPWKNTKRIETMQPQRNCSGQSHGLGRRCHERRANNIDPRPPDQYANSQQMLKVWWRLCRREVEYPVPSVRRVDRCGNSQGAATMSDTKTTAFTRYRRTQIVEMRPYTMGERLSDRVSISAADREAGSPKVGDMVARNPANHDDQWLVARAYFDANFEALS